MTKKVLIALFILIGITFTGCKSVDMTSNKTGWSDYASIVVKDYEVIDHIFVESTEVTKVGIFKFKTTISGSTITYDMLIKEAIALGADDVINVRIEAQDLSNKSFLNSLFGGYTETIKYTANALAIKYLDEAEAETRKGDSNNPSGMMSGTGESGLLGLFGGN
ncbi:hypothetical protein [Spirochaeta isovalerica]|uniref:Uncharacterized protein YbjQ (UPF0145 family) n=1 Tax=Spirochaeta isovalerica TaxID=150 RepID=A0A841RIU6_9SPIO|nr:hypothetical protein [Spirochaeta isovalerica]MBB6482649.1 uncharacterized protein YbjQ (UPF0145 family) [Spirochaeta isovalerica]